MSSRLEADHVYLNAVKKILYEGQVREDRTGVGTKGIFGLQSRYDVSKSFPLLTTKKVHFKSVVYELLWFLRGDTNVKYLQDHGVRIWNEWADENGDLGPVYGKQWRRWEGADGTIHDQIANLIDGLKNNPYSRRHIVNAWKVDEVLDMALPPCHLLFQFYVSNDNRLSLQLYQRSADMFLGVPFNIASYALLLMLVAKEVGMYADELVHTIGDAHIYTNHMDQIHEQLSREPKKAPLIGIADNKSILATDGPKAYDYNDILLMDYDCHPTIKAKVAV